MCAGHFLPTDRVGHWGVLTGKDFGKDLSKFDEVAPTLPKVLSACSSSQCTASQQGMLLLSHLARAVHRHCSELTCLPHSCCRMLSPSYITAESVFRRKAFLLDIDCLVTFLYGSIRSNHRSAVLQGWHWQGAEWHVDKAGFDLAAVDAEGWSYAVDFGWLHNPPLSGAGRFKRVSMLHA